MERVFTSGKSCTQIRALWRAEKFGNRTRCLYCEYERKFWTLGKDKWKCPRCRKEFNIFTRSWIERTRFHRADTGELGRNI